MLNVFMLFANIFLRLLFFLAGLIPQLLQKSQFSFLALSKNKSSANFRFALQIKIDRTLIFV